MQAATTGSANNIAPSASDLVSLRARISSFLAEKNLTVAISNIVVTSTAIKLTAAVLTIELPLPASAADQQNMYCALVLLSTGLNGQLSGYWTGATYTVSDILGCASCSTATCSIQVSCDLGFQIVNGVCVKDACPLSYAYNSTAKACMNANGEILSSSCAAGLTLKTDISGKPYCEAPAVCPSPTVYDTVDKVCRPPTAACVKGTYYGLIAENEYRCINEYVCRVGYKFDPLAYQQTYCVDVNECAGDNPCEGTATCQNTVGSFICRCRNTALSGNGRRAIYSPANEKPGCFDPCASSPCLFGGRCSSVPKILLSEVKPICNCVNSYSGDLCEKDNFFCSSQGEQACLNGGTCVPGLADLTANPNRNLA